MTPARKYVLASTALLLGASVVAGAAVQGVGQAAIAWPSRPMMFGAEANTTARQQAEETAAHHKLTGVRVYRLWGQPVFGSQQIAMRNSGHTLFISVKSQRQNGAVVTWSSIAAAAPGSTLYREIQSMATQIKAFRSTVYFIFNHEPEAKASLRMGNGPQFAAAWRKIVTIFRASGVRNAYYVATFTDWGFSRKDSRNVRYYYPGDAYVDAIAADAYNWAGCRGVAWEPLSQRIEGLRVFGLSHARHLMLMEFGTVEDPKQPGRKAQWFRDAEAMFKTAKYAQFNAAIYYTGAGMPTCKWDYTTSASSQAAFGALSADAHFQAR